MWSIDHHTADVRVLMEPEGSTSRNDVAFTVRLGAADSTALLVDFLNEALTPSHTRRAAFTDVNFQSFATKLAAPRIGQKVRGFGEDVESVTCHGARAQ